MVAAGEDPRFIARRLIIAASEDVGNADPRGSRSRSRRAGARSRRPPEAQYALAQATTYSRPRQVEPLRAGLLGRRGGRGRARQPPVPLHLRTAANPRMKHHGIGVGYRYPHDFDGADVEQRYLPDAIDGKRYYLPTDQGYESTISERIARRAAAREQARETGKTPKSPFPAPEVPRSAAGNAQRKREENRKKLAETARGKRLSAGPSE